MLQQEQEQKQNKTKKPIKKYYNKHNQPHNILFGGLEIIIIMMVLTKNKIIDKLVSLLDRYIYIYINIQGAN